MKKRFTDEQKLEFLAKFERLQAEGKTLRQIEQELDIGNPQLYVWKKLFTSTGGFSKARNKSNKRGPYMKRLTDEEMQSAVAQAKARVAKGWSVKRAAKKSGISAATYYRFYKEVEANLHAGVPASPAAVKKTNAVLKQHVDTVKASRGLEVEVQQGSAKFVLKGNVAEISELLATFARIG